MHWAANHYYGDMQAKNTNDLPVTEPLTEINRKRSLWVFAATVVAMLATTLSPPLLRMFSTDIWQVLDMSEVEWSVMLAIRGLVLVFFVLAAGVVGDLYGRRRALLLALSGYLISSLIAATTSQRGVFLVMENLLPPLDAFVKTMTVTLLLLAFSDARERLYAFTAYSILLLLAFFLSPWFAEQMGQETAVRRTAYAVSVALTALGLLLVAKKVPESRAFGVVRARNVIALGAWVAGACTVVFAVLLAGSVGWRSPLVLGTLAVGGATLFAVTWLKRHPLREKWRLAVSFERRLGIAILAGVFLNLALYAVTAQIFNFLRRVQGYGPVPAALRMGPLAVGAILLGTLAARLTINVGVRNALSIGLLIVAASAAGFAFLQPDIAYWAIAILLAMLGFGFIIGNSPYLLLLSSSVPRDLFATAQAIGRATSQLGAALAYALMLALIAGFGQRAFVRSAESAELSQSVIQERTSSVAAAAGDTSWVLASETQLQALEVITPGIQRAYTLGLSRAMLVLAGMCIVGAMIVRLGLPALKEGQQQKAQS